jgi:hypothetical protein
MTTPLPEQPARGPRRKGLGCLAALLVLASFLVYTFASLEIFPPRAFHRAHERLRAGQSLPEAAGVLLELMESQGHFTVSQPTDDGKQEPLLTRGSALPTAEALAARIDRSRPVWVRMSTIHLSGLFTVLMEADGTVREVSKIDGYVK